MVRAFGSHPRGQGFEPPRLHQQKTHFCLPTKVRFLNDVCLRQMMTVSPNDVRFANDVWLRHILWQPSHHCNTKWCNIIFAKQMHHIAVGEASLKFADFYDIIYSINSNLSNSAATILLVVFTPTYTPFGYSLAKKTLLKTEESFLIP